MTAIDCECDWLSRRIFATETGVQRSGEWGKLWVTRPAKTLLFPCKGWLSIDRICQKPNIIANFLSSFSSSWPTRNKRISIRLPVHQCNLEQATWRRWESCISLQDNITRCEWERATNAKWNKTEQIHSSKFKAQQNLHYTFASRKCCWLWQTSKRHCFDVGSRYSNYSEVLHFSE